MTQRSETARRCRILASAFVLLVFWCAAATAAPVKVQQILGDWEATRLLVTEGESNAQRFMNPDDANVIGSKFGFQMQSLTQINAVDDCTLDTSLAGRTFPMKTLFAGEGLPRPALVRDKFYRRMGQYALGGLAREPVTLYAYRCKDRDRQLNTMGNWFAATKDTIIWPLAPDALVLLKPQPKTPTAEQAAFCKTAVRAADKVICKERELWLMKTYTEAVRACAITNAPPARANMADVLDGYVAKRNKCEADRECIVYALQEHVGLLAKDVPSTADCIASGKK